MKYDYIIAGAGCAGLSLAYRMAQSNVLKNKKLLIVDQERKTENDRTWCFWEKNENTFEDIVCKRWNKLLFKSKDFENQFDLKSYTYKMIKGEDFYKYVWKEFEQNPNIHFSNDQITSLEVDDNRAKLTAGENTYYADYIFNSTGFFNPDLNDSNTLLQHFMGWVIVSEEDHFDPDLATLMDFSVDQKHGATFMYTLPLTKRKALVEYTLFTKDVLKKEEYREELRKYIKEDIGLSNYVIEHEEFGIIPMTMAKFSRTIGQRIINLGTAGGYTKASSGYTFYAIQQHTSKIIELLEQGEPPVIEKEFRDKMFDWYDRTLLDVIINKKKSGDYIFSTLFRKINPETILTFLSNESQFKDELKIMWSLNSSAFIASGIKQLIR